MSAGLENYQVAKRGEEQTMEIDSEDDIDNSSEQWILQDSDHEENGTPEHYEIEGDDDSIDIKEEWVEGTSINEVRHCTVYLEDIKHRNEEEEHVETNEQLIEYKNEIGIKEDQLDAAKNEARSVTIKPKGGSTTQADAIDDKSFEAEGDSNDEIPLSTRKIAEVRNEMNAGNHKPGDEDHLPLDSDDSSSNGEVARDGLKESWMASWSQSAISSKPKNRSSNPTIKDAEVYHMNSKNENLQIAYLQEIKDQLSSIQRTLVAMDNRITDLTQRIDINYTPFISTFSSTQGSVENIKKILPLNSREDAENFEKLLENSAVINEFLMYIDRIGGNSPKEITKNIFARMFTNHFAKEYSWTGHKDNFCVADLLMTQIVKDKVVSGHRGFTEHEFDEGAKSWFRTGSQRFAREGQKTINNNNSDLCSEDLPPKHYLYISEDNSDSSCSTSGPTEVQNTSTSSRLLDTSSYQTIKNDEDYQSFTNSLNENQQIAFQEIKDYTENLSSNQKTAVDSRITDLTQSVDINSTSRLIGSARNIRKFLPFNTREDAETFDKQLGNSISLNEFLFFIDVGGKTPSKIIRRILSKLFTNCFAKRYTWTGRKDKFCVAELKMIQIARDKVVSGHRGFTEYEFDERAKDWFRFGSQRYARESKKLEKFNKSKQYKYTSIHNYEPRMSSWCSSGPTNVQNTSSSSRIRHTSPSKHANSLNYTDQLSPTQSPLTAIDIKVTDLAPRVDINYFPPKFTGSVENIKKVLPLNNREDAENFDKQLENSTLRNEFIIFIDRIGGNKPAENTRNILSKMFTNNFAKDYTWTGRKENFCIAELKMIHIARDRVVSNYIGFTNFDFDEESKDWFRFGSQRFQRDCKKRKLM